MLAPKLQTAVLSAATEDALAKGEAEKPARFRAESAAATAMEGGVDPAITIEVGSHQVVEGAGEVVEGAGDAEADRAPSAEADRQSAEADRQSDLETAVADERPPASAAMVSLALQPGRTRVVNDRLTVLSVVNNNMGGLNILDIMTSVLGNFVDEDDVIANGAKNYLRESYMLASLGENNEDVGKIVWKSLYENKNMGITTSVGVERFIVGGGSYGIYNDVTGVLINFYEKKKAHGKVRNARHIYFLGRK
jgi:hypothetical protein